MIFKTQILSLMENEMNNTILESLIPAIIGALIGGMFTIFTLRSSLKRQSVQTIYENTLFPISLILEQYKEINESNNISEKEIRKIKKDILKILKNNNGSYSTAFYEASIHISAENFQEYCTYITRKCNICKNKLNYLDTFNFFGKEYKKGKIICWSSLIIASIIAILCSLITFKFRTGLILIIVMLFCLFLFIKHSECL